MSIKRVTIASDYPLEGMLQEGSRRGGVVICHPHPLYGGEMHNNVVSAVEAGFSENGFTTLRFNFRGVGGSSGGYDEGEGEVTDALAALAFLRSHLDEGARVVLAGYSFGAWIAAKAASGGANVDTLFLVSYPFAFYPADELERFDKQVYFIGGTTDDIGPVDALLKVYKNLTQVQKNLKIIATDHFYGGKETEITGFIREHVDRV
jgi:uncharacterized protein